jgi:lipopolysaccharide heptosyltransferase II
LNTINRLLIIRLSSLGDILLTTPIIRALKNKFPEAKIDFLLREEYEDTLKYNLYLNKTILLKRDYGSEELIAALKSSNYELIINLQNNGRSRGIVKRIGVKAVKYKKKNLLKFLLVKFNFKSNSKLLSVPEKYANALPELQLDEKGLDLFLPEGLKNNLDSNKKYIGLCPGSRHFTKKYPEEYFIELGKAILESGRQVVLFGGSDDLEVNDRLHSNLTGSINLSNNNDLLQTANDMKFCEAIICNDSGLMHTATAVGVPVVAIFGSTVTDFGFAPYNNPNLILENKSLNCRPCSHIGRSSCPKRHFKCMKEIYPHLVFESLTKMLSRNV